jgi:hypothetical protein
MFGFLGLVLMVLSGYNPNGSFSYIPLSEGIVDITMLINMVLCCLNAFICVRLVRDELPVTFQDEEEKRLFYFFQARCGVTRVEFQEMFKNGCFIKLNEGDAVPRCRDNLYLVLEGKVHCQCKFGHVPTEPFIKRSGEFFDIRLFNLFTFPIGFDNTHFEAHTLMPTKLFQWDLEGLKRMRENHMITPFWEFTVLRSLSASGVKRHLQKTDTLYDALCIPEDDEWLEGAPSRDFLPRLQARNTLRRQLQMMAGSLQVFPPHGVRHRPRILEPNPIPFEEISRSDLSVTSSTSHLGGNDEEQIPP